MSSPEPIAASNDVWLDTRRQEQLIWAFVGLALAARAVRFLLCFPLWEDECFLVSNFIDRPYADLLRPLNYHQVAPPLFLASELTAVKLLGFNEWSLRLFPFVCSVGSLLLFRQLAGRLLKGPARVVAVAAFCASYSGIRYAAEAKPYGPDQLVALVLLTAAVEWWRGSRRTLWLAVLIVFAPLAIGLSYPAVFVCGGVSLLMAVVLFGDLDCRRRWSKPSRVKQGGWSGWLLYNASLLSAFLLLLGFAAKGQSEAELAWMQDYWKEHLPSLTSPVEWIVWLFKTHTGDLLAIPLGGERGASIVTFLLVITGTIALFRARQHRLLALCLAPPALNLLAALMGRFPYGGHVKFSQYLAPAICILLGVGGAALIARSDAANLRWRRLAVGLAVLALIPLGTIGRDFVCPYKSPTDARYRDFARWFWPSLQFSGEAACLYRDLGREFAPGTFRHLGWSAMYLCNQQIYSPRHARGGPVDWQRVSRDWPLHVIEYRAQVYQYQDAACHAWLDAMSERYELASRDEFPSPVFDQRGQNLLCADRLVLYKFVPRGDGINR
ncbi:MAG TPA: glycosyltransferase family 39 protein [Pirellulales bacterium]|nr:glycosyltransferase family 39 protein [Pirellulales bacterium]